MILVTEKSRGILAKLALLSATIIWGSTFFIMEDAIKNIGIFTLLAFRFIGAGILLGAILHKKLKNIDRSYFLCGAIMGVFVISAYIAQTYGLKDDGTTAGKNAFLTAIYCIIVPFMFWGVAKVRPDGYNIIAALLCLFGVTLVSMDGSGFGSICKGDWLTLLGGVFYACHMVSVSIFSKNRDVLLLTAIQFITAGLIALVPALMFDKMPQSFPMSGVTAILYLTVMATCVCYILQNVGQKFTPPSSAALILSLEAVFGVIFSMIFSGERLTFRLFMGFAVIFAAIIISELKPKLSLKIARKKSV